MYSHNSDVKIGERTFVLAISREMCVNLVKFGQLNYREVIIAELLNSANRRSITVAGKLSTKGDCKGTAYND